MPTVFHWRVLDIFFALITRIVRNGTSVKNRDSAERTFTFGEQAASANSLHFSFVITCEHTQMLLHDMPS